MKQRTQLTTLTRWLALPAIVVALSACGGGDGGSSGDDSGDTEINPVFTDPNGDDDGDGIENFRDVDATGGVDDDFDGIDDSFQAGTNDPNGDDDNDGIANFEDVDSTGGVDDNFDGIDDAFQGGDGDGGAGTDLGPCEGTSGTDPDSSNDDWGDNCFLSNGNAHSESSYTRGVQRILNCLGYPVTADADFGPGTEQAVIAFQSDNPPLAVDGIVGPETWRGLRNTLESVPFDISTDAYSVAPYDPDGDGIDNSICIGEALFYQSVDGAELGGWTMATEIGSIERGPFSIGF